MSKPLAPLAPLDLAQRYTIPEAAQYLRVCRAYVYQLIAKGGDDGGIDTIVDGKRRFVPGSEIARRSKLPQQVSA